MDKALELASMRNAVRLEKLTSCTKALAILNALSESNSKLEAKKERDTGKICCPLPFTLQDHCLLVIVSDLDTHEKELLASLPRRLRDRLLHAVSALDFCRLERTPVADGIDVDAIWKSRWTKTPLYPSLKTVHSSAVTGSNFQLNVSKVDDLNLDLVLVSSRSSALVEAIKLAFDDVTHSKIPHGKECLLSSASDILTKFPKIDLNAIIHKLISVEGELLLSTLLSGSMHYPCSTLLCNVRVWKKQATSLAVNVKFSPDFLEHPHIFKPFGFNFCREKAHKISLTPHRHLPILYDQDPLQVLSLLAKDCSLRPSSAYIHIESLYESFLQNLTFEQLACDSGSTSTSDELKCSSIMKCFLEMVVILRLRCDSYSNVGVMNRLIQSATVDQKHSQLRYFFCTLQNLYTDVVPTLISLFSLQTFHQLFLQVDELYPLMFSKLLQGFMAVSCSHKQKLIVHSKKDLVLPKSLKETQIAMLEYGSAHIGEAQNKAIQLSSKKELTKTLYLLLQMPSVRLKEIALVSLHDYFEYIHLCALHPNLQTTKLLLDLTELRTSHSVLATIQADIVSLFTIPSLQKIVISGNWGKHDEIKLGIVQGLRGRIRLLPLQKLALELELNNSYKMRDFQTLCDAIFSLPHVENLKLVLGKGFCDMIRQPGYEETFYRSWRIWSSKVQLKSICLQTYKTKFERISLVTQTLTFSLKQRRQERNLGNSFGARYLYGYGQGYFDYYDDCYDEYYDDDDDFGDVFNDYDF